MSKATQQLADVVFARVPRPPNESPLTVAEWLDRSTAAHLAYRQAHDARHHADAIAAMEDAAVARAQAERLDPDHLDIAWQDNGGTHAAGMASHVDFQEPLLRFYVNKLELVRPGDPPINPEPQDSQR